jgi:hypothetical protein
MRAACSAVYEPTKAALKWAACMNRAQLYFDLVRTEGDSSYKEGQIAACECCICADTPGRDRAARQGDVNNCGSCGNACKGGQTCVDGGCKCPEGESLCPSSGGEPACKNLMDDDKNCGGCGAGCPRDAPLCNSGVCDDKCAPDPTCSSPDIFDCRPCGRNNCYECMDGTCHWACGGDYICKSYPTADGRPVGACTAPGSQ